MSVNRSFPPYVYFVRRADGEGPVKIGCSQVPQDRLSALMTWSPYPLEILATLPGDETLERRFHAAFADAYSHREWFRPVPELIAMLALLRAGAFDVDTLPGPKVVFKPRQYSPLPEATRRGMSWTHRLRHLQNRGVEIPQEVRSSAFRWSAGRYSKDYDPHNPADAEVVEAFLANHPRLAD